MNIRLFLSLVFSWLVVFVHGQNNEEVVSHLQSHVYFLADDSLEGRMTGTEGEKIAYRYIITQFKSMGVSPKGDDGYLQKFNFTSGKKTGKTHQLRIDDEILGESSYFTLFASPESMVDGESVFAGYGIEAPGLDHNDYARIDVEDKIVVMELSTPDGIHPHSKFKDFSTLNKKVALAASKGAEAVLLVNNDPHLSPPEKEDYSNTEFEIPVAFIVDSAWQQKLMYKVCPIHFNIDWDNPEVTGHNVVGYIDNNAEKTVIIGAHYDHLGYGIKGSSLHSGNPAIHNGADDNASGVAVMIELARALKQREPASQNYLLIAFSGEELGLYGSNYFTDNPSIDLEKVNYMINLDMVGRLDTQTNALAVNGYGTSPAWDEYFSGLDLVNISIKSSLSGIGPSDHTNFYLKDIPVLHFFTGTHRDYHTPRDDAHLINWQGTYYIYDLILDLVTNLDEDLTFTKTKQEESRKAPKFSVTLGVMPDYMFDGNGMRIEGVSEDKPAQEAGIQAGDIVLKMGGHEVSDMMTYMKALSQFEKDQTVEVVILRDDKKMTIPVTF